MTVQELSGRYARLNNEIDALAAAGERHPGRMGRLLAELDELHRQIALERRRKLAVPTLHDAVDAAPLLRAAAG